MIGVLLDKLNYIYFVLLALETLYYSGISKN